MSFDAMKARLWQHGIGLRAAMASNLYYATTRSRKSYSIRYTPEGWSCYPLGQSTQWEADRVLNIALGRLVERD